MLKWFGLAQGLRSSSAAAPPTLSRAKQTPSAAKRSLPPSDVLDRIESLLLDNAKDKNVIHHIKKSSELLQHTTDREQARKIAEALAATRHPLQSLRFLQIAHILGCKHKDNAYECVSFCLSQQKNWAGVLSTVSLAQEHRGRLSSRLLNWRTRAEVETEKYQALQHTLDDFRESNSKPTRRTFHLVLSGHIRNRNLVKAKKTLQEMADAGFPPDETTHAIIATHYRRLGKDPDVETQSLEILPSLRPTTAVAVLNSLITLRLDAHDIEGALRLTTLFCRPNVDPIISVMTDGAGWTNLQNISNIPASIVPNAATYSVYINWQAARSNLHGALQIFRAMLATQTPVSPGVVASLIHALYAGGKGDIAVRMVTKMCNQVSAPFFNRLYTSQIHDDIPWSPIGIPPTIRVFNSFIKGVLSTHRIRGMETVLKIMHDNKVIPNAATLEILLRHVQRFERGYAPLLGRIVKKLSSHDLSPNLRHMHIVLASILRRKRNLIYRFGWDNSAAKFSSTRKTPMRYPNDQLADEADFFDPMAGIDLSSALGRHVQSSSIIDSLRSRDVKSDSAMFALRIRHDALVHSDLGAAKEIFDVMLDRGISPNEYHFSALMEGHTRAGDMQSALDVMETANQAGVKPNAIMFTILIVGYAHKGNPNKAIRTFEDMISTGIAPDVASIDAVTSAFFMIGAYEMAKTVLRTLWSSIQPLPPEHTHMSLKRLIQTFRLLHVTQRHGDYGLSVEDRVILRARLRRLRSVWRSMRTHTYDRMRH
ncbi:hypothetical protein H0H92_001484 [Tricholoma furcatifolium]|nr:hypothetical protein H0H92_001484 [Tricholoma furcatifolium]